MSSAELGKEGGNGIVIAEIIVVLVECVKNIYNKARVVEKFLALCLNVLEEKACLIEKNVRRQKPGLWKDLSEKVLVDICQLA